MLFLIECRTILQVLLTPYNLITQFGLSLCYSRFILIS